MPDQAILTTHFASREDLQSQNSGWDQLWESDQDDLWDRGIPSIALIDWVESQPSSLPKPAPGNRLKALVPGCGRGYDVAMLALHGFDVVGLEISSKGADAARAYAEQELAEPHDYNFGSSDAARPKEPGTVTIATGDFFDPSWTSEKFHLIYDYTFLCAINPDMRLGWGQRMRDLVHPSGVVVCLEFPLFKQPSEIGPAWPVKGVYWQLLAKGNDGKGVQGDEPEVAADDDVFVRETRLMPPRSYSNGRGTDMLSVWQLNTKEARASMTH